MTRLKPLLRTRLLFTPFLSLLLLAGCAPPPASDALMQQRLDELLKIQQQQAEQLAGLQQQLQDLQPAAVPLASAPEPEPEPAAPILPLPLAPAAEEIAELSATAGLYLEAFAALATGRMVEAEAGFKAFITRYPEHEYVGNANYWLAEALLAQQQDAAAETVLLAIIDDPRQQNRAPAAMARLVAHYRTSGAQQNAAAMLETLEAGYPESPELKRLMRGPQPR